MMGKMRFRYKIGIIVIIFAAALIISFYFSPKEITEEKIEEEPKATEEVFLDKEDKKVEEVEEEVPETLLILDVPFVVQAPFAEWDNPIYQDGCEEAASLMAILWAKGSKGISRLEAKEEIDAIAEYQKEKYGQYQDTSVIDTVERIIKGYFNYKKAEVKEDIALEDIIDEVSAGNLVIVPCNGQWLGNPYYTRPGPERHNLVIRGYDADKREFITNDPGTKRGEMYRYNEDVLYQAIRDYPTGAHLPIEGIKKNMIVVIF